ncbi:MAG: hypothetical protein QM740_06135 [Acidovorax sp.]
MKNPYYEALGRRMREYHRSHQWRLSEGGLFVPHAYEDVEPDSLSYWDDVGFILNGRRFIVWWQHPRNLHREAIESKAWEEAGDAPHDNWLFEGGTTNYKRVGKSGKRKKVSSYTSRAPSETQRLYYARLREIAACLTREGIDMAIRPSWKWSRLNWAMGVSLVAPMEVRNEQDLAAVAHLARQLVLQKTTLAERFPGFVYDRTSWLREFAPT